MPTDATFDQDVRSRLVRRFATDCVKCLLRPADTATSVAKTAEESTASSSDPAKAMAVGMYRLSSLIENAAAVERAEDHNLRYYLRDAGQVGAAADLLADERHLEALCEDIRQQVAQRVVSGQHAPTSESVMLVVSALTTTLIGIHSARLDGNWQGLETAWSWCGRTLPRGYQPESYTLLRAADYYRQFGSARRAMANHVSTQIPSPEALDNLLAEAHAELENTSEEEVYLRRLRLFLVDAVSQLPPGNLRFKEHSKENYAEWLNNVLRHEPDPHSRFKYNLSRARFAQNRIPEAIMLSIDALQSAPPSDLPYIELCRQQLLMLEQEAASREDIEAELSESIRAELEESVEKAKTDVKDETQDIVDSSQEAIRSEIKDSLLRVIEILGVFLAVAGVAVTAVGGIAAGGSVGRALTIYGLGFLTIVLLFFILRLMVLAPLIIIRKKSRKKSRARKKSRKKSRDRSNPGASGPALNAPDAT